MDIDFNTQVFDDYRAWAKRFTAALQNYQGWLEAKGLDAEHVTEALFSCRPLIRLIVTGEFGRGKTEIINALLASEVGQRLLPVHVGRATMTPTEFMYDPDASNYVRFLPIETLKEDANLGAFFYQPDRWQHYTLQPEDAANTKHTLSKVAEFKAVSIKQATELGFDPDFLEPTDNKANVLIPAWRYALVNLDHPLLKAGLSLVDTPGLNAVGVESATSMALTSRAGALLHVLSTATGVTASDMQAWQETVLPAARARHMPLFAVINKLDLLDKQEEAVSVSLERIKRIAMKLFDLPESKIFALSARFAARAAIENDDVLLKRSGFKYFSQGLVQQLPKERLKKLKTDVLVRFIKEAKAHEYKVKKEKLILEKDLAKLKDTQYDVETHHLKTKNSLEVLSAQLKKNCQHYLENTRDIDASLEHVMHIFSSKQFDSHRQRALSIIDDGSDLEDVQKARNILLSGLRLDLKRIDMDIKVLNNAMRALYKDLRSEFEAQPVTVNVFHECIQQAPEIRLAFEQGAKQTFTKQVATPLEEVFVEQRELITAWHRSHIEAVSKPLENEKAHLAEQQAVEKQLEERMTERANQLGHAQKRLPEVTQEIERISAVLADFKALV